MQYNIYLKDACMCDGSVISLIFFLIFHSSIAKNSFFISTMKIKPMKSDARKLPGSFN